ncbi:ProQ/FINO family protein [Paenacidovorax monticola]|uniref:Fertility inhibition FinO n=1 Tax=Paenacidovorax monticola TaxID=1926868 RepID=A0A7H0HCJ6_9BURK|nr:ProQ/FINO family protein [Paenacidovorax monticola]QNP58262.1 Fertility inhibition FinO [Paenacidovorax monticola]
MTDSVSATPEQNAAPAAAVAPAAAPAQAPRARGGRRGSRGGQGRRPEGAAPAAASSGSQAAPARAPRTHPLLEQLAAWYPRLFGAEFLPLKRGIFQDLLDAHADAIDKEALKLALSIHTRSTRYLTAVAAGLQRHDLQGQPVEAMAPEHVHHALLEVFRRRQQRGGEDLAPKLRNRIVQAFEASGLTRDQYAELVRGRDEKANALLDEALAEAAARAAKDEALLRAFEASGQSAEAFADMYGMPARQVGQTLERARRRRAPGA